MADALAGAGPHLGRQWEREVEDGARLELEELDEEAGTLRMGPLVQQALALAGESEAQRWAATLLDSRQRLEARVLWSVFGPPVLASLPWQGWWAAGCSQNCLGSADPVHLCLGQGGGGQTPQRRTNAHPGPGPSTDSVLYCVGVGAASLWLCLPPTPVHFH